MLLDLITPNNPPQQLNLPKLVSVSCSSLQDTKSVTISKTCIYFETTSTHVTLGLPLPLLTYHTSMLRYLMLYWTYPNQPNQPSPILSPIYATCILDLQNEKVRFCTTKGYGSLPKWKFECTQKSVYSTSSISIWKKSTISYIFLPYMWIDLLHL